MKRTLTPRLAGAALLVGLLAAWTASGSSSTVSPFEAMTRRVEASLCEILVRGHLAGSGWIADASGLVVTANHVVGDGAGVEVLGPFGRAAAIRVAADPANDLALLQLEGLDEVPLPTLTLGDRCETGDELHLLGAPLYRHGLVLPGRVGRATPGFEYHAGGRHYVEGIYLVGPSPPGTSGGPWVDRDGAVRGVQSMRIDANGAGVGIAFAARASAVAELLSRGRAAPVATLNAALEELWEQPADTLAGYPAGLEGVLVKTLVASGALGRAGGQATDVILSVDGAAVRYRDELLSEVRSRAPGAAVELRLHRRGAGAPLTVRAELATLGED